MGAVYLEKRKTAFIVRSQKLHANKYDYSQVQYINKRRDVEIICALHGAFWQAPETHLRPKRRGQDGYMGCPKCSLETSLEVSSKRTKSTCLYCGRWAKYSPARCCDNESCKLQHQLSTGADTGDVWLDAFKDVLHRVNRTAKFAFRKHSDPWDVWFTTKARCINAGARSRKEKMTSSQMKTITRADLKSLAEQQKFCCALTGVDLVPDKTSADHKMPVSRGGGHCIDNLQLVTKEANTLKGSLTNEELLLLAKQIVKTLS